MKHNKKQRHVTKQRAQQSLAARATVRLTFASKQHNKYTLENGQTHVESLVISLRLMEHFGLHVATFLELVPGDWRNHAGHSAHVSIQLHLDRLHLRSE